VVFIKQRVAVFCDGDFWHGRDLESRLAKLARGHNAAYWIAKIQRNVERDRKTTSALDAAGWIVLRFWETEVLRETRAVVDRIMQALHEGRTHSQRLS
jgi:DNA mismatch endonuclease (patch repair protein)